MRVAVYPGGLAPEVGGGFTFADSVLTALGAAVDETKHSFVVFSPSARSPSPSIPHVHTDRPASQRLRSAAQATYRFARRYGDFRSERTRWLLTLMLEHEVDVIWYLTPECPVLELPFMTVVWDLQHRLQPFFPEVSAGGEWQAREDFYSTVLRRAAVVVTGNGAGQREIERFYQVPPERIRLAPHPTPTFPEADPDTLRRHGLGPGYVLYPAQFWPHKNHVRLLEALSLLRERGSVVNAVFVGSDRGNAGHVRTRAAQLGVLDQLRFPGFVSRAELAALYEHAGALTYVSYFGPENLPPLEAFSLGCPVIASDVSGAAEQLGDCAVRIDPNSAEDLAAAIERILHDEAWSRELVARGRSRAAETSADHFVRVVFDALDSLEHVRRTWP